MKALQDKISERAAEAIEDKLKYLANYAVAISPVDSGAYVESFSIRPAGDNGGRSKRSDARPKGANPDVIREIGRQNLYQDIASLGIKRMVESGDTRFILRNRAPHSRDVENGENWSRDGYHVFAKIRRKFS